MYGVSVRFGSCVVVRCHVLEPLVRARILRNVLFLGAAAPSEAKWVQTPPGSAKGRYWLLVDTSSPGVVPAFSAISVIAFHHMKQAAGATKLVQHQ